MDKEIEIKDTHLKNFSGGDYKQDIKRELYQEPIYFKPQFKVILECNTLPNINSPDKINQNQKN